jgi:hypothetical protein
VSDNINSPETCGGSASFSPHSPFDTVSLTNDFQRNMAWYCPSIPTGVTSFTVSTVPILATNSLTINVAEIKSGSIRGSAYWETVDASASAQGTPTQGTLASSVPTSASTAFSRDLVLASISTNGACQNASVGTGYTGITVNPASGTPASTPGYILEGLATSVTGVQTATTTWPSGCPGCGGCLNGPGLGWFGVITPLISLSNTAVNVSGATIKGGILQ